MASFGDEKGNGGGDEYRSFIHGEGEKNTMWKYGGPPNYDVVNKLFEEERTRIWPPGSLEYKVQNIVKTMEMELFHKANHHDVKSIDINKFTMSVNGEKALTLKGIREIDGGYNTFLQTSLPKKLRMYDPDEETAESANNTFLTVFPRGFALEVLEVYSGPPRITFKFRHWAYMEGPFKGHAPTGDRVDEEMRVVKVEYFFDRGEFLAPLIKGAKLEDLDDLEKMLSSCPIMAESLPRVECKKMSHLNPKSSSDEERDDKYRSFIHGESEKNTMWRFGAPPNYDVVNKLFEEGQTKIWPLGSLEEKVQRVVKTFEMELLHKTRPKDFKLIDPTKFTMSVNGAKALSSKGVAEIGGAYNAFLQTTLPKELRVYDPQEETAETSHVAFGTTFPRGFALEVLEVYSGPPCIAIKFRHWAYMEGPFKGYAPTGELAEFYGMATFKMDENMKVVKVEFFFDGGQLLASLTKGVKLDDKNDMKEMLSKCPMGRTG
ncbi:hypothetical protein V2J09_007655 [Rumex salicifolius]